MTAHRIWFEACQSQDAPHLVWFEIVDRETGQRVSTRIDVKTANKIGASLISAVNDAARTMMES